MAITLKLTLEMPGDEPDREFQLVGEDATVGRDNSCDLIVENHHVSGRHGMFQATANGYTYTDLSSRNGSAVQHEGADDYAALHKGEPVLLKDQDLLLLGGAEEPARLHVVEASSLYDEGAVTNRTIVATAPLVDVTDGATGELDAFAGLAIGANTAEDLAKIAYNYLESLFPAAHGYGVVITGTGFSAVEGSEIPGGIAAEALSTEQIMLIDDPLVALSESQSVAVTGMKGVVIAPLVTKDSAHGFLAVWSNVGVGALGETKLKPLAVVASLLALSASSLAVRYEGEERRRRLEAQVADIASKASSGRGPDPLGTSPSFVASLNLCRAVSSSGVPVLLNGETGSGKEVLARAVHRWSPRSSKQFVAFNCAAVPESLVESELFGHVRGAFTGAASDRKGLFEEADGGTIFLDEIGEMPANMQAKLLRVLQDGEIRPVGAARSKQVDVRVISATHRDLEKKVEEGSFRQDLMYRLNAVTVRIPPLRERREDVSLLAHHLLGRVARDSNKKIPGFSREALSVLSGYDFPGNIRELENEIRRSVALTPDGQSVQVSSFSERLVERSGEGPSLGLGTMSGTLKECVEAAERMAVDSALKQSEGNVSQAARILGLTRPGLYKVMDRLGITR
jgi:transcriptional regulator with GAF, ATPase, and Fis domain